MPEWRTDSGTQGDLPPWVRNVLGGDRSSGRSPDDPPPGLPPIAPPVAPNPLAQPSAPRRRGGWWLGGAVVLVLALIAVPLLAGRWSGGPAPKASAPPLAWDVDACVRMVSTPRPYPSGLDYNGRRLWDRQNQYGTVACTDPSAEGRITAKGAQYSRSETIAGRRIESGCPEDTDFEMHVSDQHNLGSQIWCVQKLKPPHVYDPGQGGGRIVANDCVMVTTGSYSKRNDRINELPCTETHFAKVLATAPNVAGCPADTLSRLPDPVTPGSVLCLGLGPGALIVRPGECISWPSNMFDIVRRVPCTDRLVYHMVTFADTEKGCGRGLSPFTINGYDRFVCLRSPSG